MFYFTYQQLVTHLHSGKTNDLKIFFFAIPGVCYGRHMTCVR